MLHKLVSGDATLSSLEDAKTSYWSHLDGDGELFMWDAAIYDDTDEALGVSVGSNVKVAAGRLDKRLPYRLLCWEKCAFG